MNESDITGSNHSIQTGADAVPPMLKQAGEQASRMAQRGLDALHDGSQNLRHRAQLVSDGTTGYIQAEPLKAMLIAAAAGAALMGLVSLLARNGQPR